MFFKQIGTQLSIGSALLMIGSAIAIGFIMSLLYRFTHRREGHSAQFMITLIMLPTVIALIIMLIGNNIARAFSLAGAFSLIRYRSTPGNPRDLTFVLLSLAIGVACGIGYVGYAIVFALVLSALLLLLEAVKFGSRGSKNMTLTVAIPESINYEGILDDVLSEMTDASSLIKIRTTDFGTMFELKYSIRLKANISSKQFIDEIRTKNGNMNVTLTLAPTDVNEIW